MSKYILRVVLFCWIGGCAGPVGDPFQPFSSASFDDLEHWTRIDSPGLVSGPGSLEYDNDHHLLYTSACNGGAWRGQVD